jgi:hypothetical protein
VLESPQEVSMTISSKCPRKWAFVDMETGDIWMHKTRLKKHKDYPYNFYQADQDVIDNIAIIIDDWNKVFTKI